MGHCFVRLSLGVRSWVTLPVTSEAWRPRGFRVVGVELCGFSAQDVGLMELLYEGIVFWVLNFSYGVSGGMGLAFGKLCRFRPCLHKDHM